VYDGNFVVELAGGSSVILQIGADFVTTAGASLRAVFDEAEQSTVNIVSNKNGEELRVTKISLGNGYNNKALMDEVKKSLIAASYARYQVRFSTGQSRILLKVESTLDGFEIMCGVGRFSKKKKNKYIPYGKDPPSHKFKYPCTTWKTEVGKWLTREISDPDSLLDECIKPEAVMESLSQWLSKFS